MSRNRDSLGPDSNTEYRAKQDPPDRQVGHERRITSVRARARSTARLLLCSSVKPTASLLAAGNSAEKKCEGGGLSRKSGGRKSVTGSPGPPSDFCLRSSLVPFFHQLGLALG